MKNRALLDLAHRVHECTNCGRWSEHGCEPAHQNGIDSGKGMGLKSPDHRHAALCHECHSWLDQGGTKPDPTKRYRAVFAEKQEMWQRCNHLTFDLYWANGWLKVTS